MALKVGDLGELFTLEWKMLTLLIILYLAGFFLSFVNRMMWSYVHWDTWYQRYKKLGKNHQFVITTGDVFLGILYGFVAPLVFIMTIIYGVLFINHYIAKNDIWEKLFERPLFSIFPRDSEQRSPEQQTMTSQQTRK